MGDRAHYAVKENGSWERYYSHWGGYSMELDMLPGPSTATRFARLQRPVDWWLVPTECVGAALIDDDEKRLLWYANCDGDAAYREAALAVMAHTWPGWHIDWAYGRLHDLLDVLNERPSYPWYERPAEEVRADGHAAWPDTVPGADRVRGLNRLVEEFDSHQDVDSATQALSLLLGVTGAIRSAAERSGSTDVRVDMGTSFAHRPMDLTDDERAAVHAAFTAVRRRIEPGNFPKYE